MSGCRLKGVKPKITKNSQGKKKFCQGKFQRNFFLETWSRQRKYNSRDISEQIVPILSASLPEEFYINHEISLKFLLTGWKNFSFGYPKNKPRTEIRITRATISITPTVPVPNHRGNTADSPVWICDIIRYSKVSTKKYRYKRYEIEPIWE